ncbi:glycosyltransferase family protein [Nocardia bovistercoris]|uniref:Glycosyltransferase n=1 Tax=Nocardia bovistercoris TaxID=2785916 RepID=A0A931I9X1_9NOCA|nr:glycosyltransferase [Nocardia bovistercoris]MBH0776746.1 hypothetical protein [Nocardia bovistercoris]
MNARTYLFALVDGGGTVPPELGMVRRLVQRGHRVTVLADESMAAEVRDTGATYLEWTAAPSSASRRPEDARYRDWECGNPFELFRMLLDEQFAGPAPGYAKDMAAALDAVHPDLAVCSFFAIGAMVAAQARGVPFDVPFPNTYLLPVPGMPPSGLGLRPARGPVGRLRDLAVRTMTLGQWNKGVPALNSLRASYGLPPVEEFFDQVHLARKHLVLTSAEFDSQRGCPRTSATSALSSMIPRGRPARRGRPRRGMSRWSWWLCRRHSRTRRVACSASSTLSRHCRCAGTSPPDPPSIPRL